MSSSPLYNGSSKILEVDQANKLIAAYTTSPSPSSTPFDSRAASKNPIPQINILKPPRSTSHLESLFKIFLPAGYPHSVTDDYLEYQIYDAIQGFASSIAGMLSSRAVLEGLGVGNPNSTPTDALLLTVLLDTIARLSTILFATHYGLSLSPECKTYRLLADIFNDVSMLLDCLSPVLTPSWRVASLVVARCCSSLCGVCAGSAKAELGGHFARGGDANGGVGEINAKSTSQATVLSLLGTLTGTLLISLLPSTPLSTWSCLLLLLLIHVSANYKAVRAVVMPSLNRQRACLLFSDLGLENWDGEKGVRVDVREKMMIPTPRQISRRERIFHDPKVLRWNGGAALGFAYIGVGFDSILECFYGSCGREDGKFASLGEVVAMYSDVKWITWYDVPKRSFHIVIKSARGRGSNGANTVLLEAWMHALLCARKINSKMAEETVMGILKEQLGVVSEMVENFGLWDRLREKGWDLEGRALETGKGRRVVIEDECEGKKDL